MQLFLLFLGSSCKGLPDLRAHHITPVPKRARRLAFGPRRCRCPFTSARALLTTGLSFPLCWSAFFVSRSSCLVRYGRPWSWKSPWALQRSVAAHACSYWSCFFNACQAATFWARMTPVAPPPCDVPQPVWLVCFSERKLFREFSAFSERSDRSRYF